MMLRFCSLGSNCEFGIAQRAVGAEPLDLLRWAATPLPVLMRLLEARFEGIGDPDKLEVISPHGESMVRHKGYQFQWHAFAKEMTAEEIHKREVKRLPFLARKLMEEINEASRIFVIKPGKGTQTDIRAFADLLRVLQTFGGKPTLLAVYDGAAPAIERHTERLFIGHVNEFADQTDAVRTTNAADWIELCRMVLHADSP